MGVVLGTNSMVSAVSPLVAALIVNGLGLGALFYYNASLWAAAVLVLSFLPLKPLPEAAASMAGGPTWDA